MTKIIGFAVGRAVDTTDLSLARNRSGKDPDPVAGMYLVVLQSIE
jgi:hypothetical protein